MRTTLVALFTVWLALLQASTSQDLRSLLDDVSGAYAKLEPQTIRPAEGYLKYDYLIPAGYYQQMWDWDGFFIGSHLAHQSRDQAKYLKGWVLGFAGAIDKEGYVAGMITTKGPVPLNGQFGKFAMKPFLAQGAVIAAERLGDYQWVAPLWPNLRRVLAYRENTQYDPKWELFFWENAMQSGTDNNVALTNDPKDPDAILAVDLCTF
jgi:alpha,alpha-trehalase